MPLAADIASCIRFSAISCRLRHYRRFLCHYFRRYAIFDATPLFASWYAISLSPCHDIFGADISPLPYASFSCRFRRHAFRRFDIAPFIDIAAFSRHYAIDTLFQLPPPLLILLTLLLPYYFRCCISIRRYCHIFSPYADITTAIIAFAALLCHLADYWCAIIIDAMRHHADIAIAFAAFTYFAAAPMRHAFVSFLHAFADFHCSFSFGDFLRR